MPFRLGRGARAWFKHVKLDLDFDAYHLCAMVGFLRGEKHTLATADAPELVDYFPEAYSGHANVLVGMLLAAELRSQGLRSTDRTLVHTVVRELVDPRSPARLSESGFAAMNAYAEGGWRALRDEFEEPPQVTSAFLVRYVGYVRRLTPRPLFA